MIPPMSIQSDIAQTSQSSPTSTTCTNSNSSNPEAVMNDMPIIDLVDYFKIRTLLLLHDQSLKNPTGHNRTLQN